MSERKYKISNITKKVDADAPQNQSVYFQPLRYLHENLAIVFLLLVLVAVSYLNSIGNAFVSDDITAIQNNPQIGNWHQIFLHGFTFSIQRLCYFLAYSLMGLNPAVFRMINIFFHFGSAIMIFLIVSFLINRGAAVISAVIFAVHPILTESVNWISAGPYIQYTFLFLCSFLCYLLSIRQPKYYYYSLAFFLLALMNSDKAISLFLIFIFCELSLGNIRLRWKKLIPYAFLGFIFFFLQVIKIGEHVQELAGYSNQEVSGLYNPLVQIPLVMAFYLKLLFWPQNLTLYHTELELNFLQFFPYLLIFFVYIGAVVWTYFYSRKAFFWLVFLFLALIPMLTPFKISWLVAERYVYLGSIGIIVVFAIIAEKFSRASESAAVATYFFLTLIIIGFSARTIARNVDWKNEDNLWQATAKVSVSSALIHNNLGQVYARQNNFRKAADEFQKAIRIYPNYADAYNNFANTCFQIGQTDAAIDNYQKALDINPEMWQSYENLSIIYFNLGDYSSALENTKKALEINPEDQGLQGNLKIIESKIRNSE
jgi:protein O-mannosyl-transferase